MANYSSVEEIKGSEEAFLEVEEAFQQIVDRYSGRRGGKFSRLIFADICFSSGRTDKAISLYQQALGDFEQIEPYHTLILKSLGYANEEKDNVDEAIQYFERIISATDSPMKDEALFALGRLYTAMGQNEKGIDAYKQLIVDFPDYMYKEIVREKISG
jgi:tetratricopeptide (TPR) repeat protein